MLTRGREFYQKMIGGLVSWLVEKSVPPALMTFLGLLMALASALLYYASYSRNECILAAAALLLLSGFFDTLDGAVARASDRVSPFGSFLDSVTDRYTDSAVGIAITVAGLCSVFWGALYIVGFLLVSYARAKGELAGIEMEGVGFAERGDRMILLACVSTVSYFYLRIFEYGIAVLALLAHVTVLQRAIHVRSKLKEHQ